MLNRMNVNFTKVISNQKLMTAFRMVVLTLVLVSALLTTGIAVAGPIPGGVGG